MMSLALTQLTFSSLMYLGEGGLAPSPNPNPTVCSTTSARSTCQGNACLDQHTEALGSTPPNYKNAITPLCTLLDQQTQLPRDRVRRARITHALFGVLRDRFLSQLDVNDATLARNLCTSTIEVLTGFQPELMQRMQAECKALELVPSLVQAEDPVPKLENRLTTFIQVTSGLDNRWDNLGTFFSLKVEARKVRNLPGEQRNKRANRALEHLRNLEADWGDAVSELRLTFEQLRVVDLANPARRTATTPRRPREKQHAGKSRLRNLGIGFLVSGGVTGLTGAALFAIPDWGRVEGEGHKIYSTQRPAIALTAIGGGLLIGGGVALTVWRQRTPKRMTGSRIHLLLGGYSLGIKGQF